MYKVVLFFLSMMFLFSCEKEKQVDDAVQNIAVSFEVDRFEQLLYDSPVEDIPEIRNQYSYLFPKTLQNSSLVQKVQDSLYRELYNQVQKKYGDFTQVESELTLLFKHLKFHFPAFKSPNVTTVISEMDYENKVVFTDSLVLISLDMYLGKEHRFYEFPDYFKATFEQHQITQDLVVDYFYRNVRKVPDRSFVSQLVFAGKEMYLKELLLPLSSDWAKMGYSEGQLRWCEANEEHMWRYFIERKLLYSTDKELVKRFVNLAPFSKFYLDLDNESPGRVGAWLGWQIVRSYMDNNPVSLHDMLVMDEKELFLKSKYKPKK